jgi:nicotinate-nucleotide--dimethylbenzimidazole phosphoribosyltransferase
MTSEAAALPAGQVVEHVVESITPASMASAMAARASLAGVVASPMLENLAASLAAAQHTSRPRAGRRVLAIVAGDHGCGDPGIAMGPDHPTVIAARAIADGSAAVCSLARPTQIVLVDGGAREAAHMPKIAIALGRGPSQDLLRQPALTIVDAVLGLQAGIALSFSLSEQGLDVLGLGAIGVGSEVTSAAHLGAATGLPSRLDEPDAAAELALVRGITLAGSSGLQRLAELGGSETCVLAGLILGAASLNVPVILDGYATGAAALVAHAFAPAVSGYLIAAQRGRFTMPAIARHLGLQPAFEGGIGFGDGSGPAMVMPLLEQVASLAARSPE